MLSLAKGRNGKLHISEERGKIYHIAHYSKEVHIIVCIFSQSTSMLSTHDLLIMHPIFLSLRLCQIAECLKLLKTPFPFISAERLSSRSPLKIAETRSFILGEIYQMLICFYQLYLIRV